MKLLLVYIKKPCLAQGSFESVIKNLHDLITRSWNAIKEKSTNGATTQSF